MSEAGHATGMAGEFHAMEILHRLGHQPALTLGNAKTIDILSRAPSGKIYEISVKAIRGGGKWGIGKSKYTGSENLVFILFLYKNFSDITTMPDVWVVPAIEAEAIKRPWQNQFGIYMYKEYEHLLFPYKSAWKNIA
jgi:hypothetical protein